MFAHLPRPSLPGFFALLFTLCASPSADADETRYADEIKPVLKARCYACHGALKQEAGLRLDTAEAARRGGDSGAAVVPGNPKNSLLIQRVSATDDDQRMPPEGKPLTAIEIKRLREWIQRGGGGPADERPEADPKEHWSFTPARRPALPTVKNARWSENPIDRFIAAQHEQQGLAPLPEADRATLLRRVFLDLTGLPPSRRQLHDFMRDTRPDAYRRVVDRLLASPQYGERWGRHWMDIWRYSDWYGRRAVNDVRNSYPHIWRWRDWIIKSLSEDKGYDRMVAEMLAADEIAPENDDAIVALGFIVRNWFSLNYDQWMKDQVEHTGKAFLGLRLNCAHCHDHKYDPITQEDYFRFRAIFEPLELRHDRAPGGPALAKYKRYTPGSGASLAPIDAGIARVFDVDLEAKTYMYRLGDSRDRFDRPPVEPGPPIFLGGAAPIKTVELPPVAWYPGLKSFAQDAEIQQRRRKSAEAKQALDKLPPSPPPGQPVKLAEAKRDAARKKLEAARADARNAKPVEKNVPADRRLGEWRFEGKDDTEFLADSSGHNHVLRRVTGRDPPAASIALGEGGRGAHFFNPLPGAETPNERGARFSQASNFAYLAAAGHPSFYQNEFTLEALVHFESARANFNRTIADYDGCWTLLHRGLDERRFELRVRLFDENSTLIDVATGTGTSPIVLEKGKDYYVALTVDAARITIHARNLSDDKPLLSRAFPRTDKTPLKRPDAKTPLKIGNSDGTGRVVGLIDEVRYSRGALDARQIAAACKSTPLHQLQRALAEAEAELERAKLGIDAAQLPRRAAELAYEHAERELAAIESRVAADKARYGSQQIAPDRLQKLIEQAARAEAEAEAAGARAAVIRAQAAIADAVKVKDTAKRKAADTAARQQLATAQKQLTAANKRLANPGDAYAPLGPRYPQTSSGRRRALANWIVRPENPLTARVAVNHIWSRHFGRPLVDSVFDFGRSGQRPSHPKLLDWLAVEMMESDWSMKRIHRWIVTSRAYRLSSKVKSDHPNLAIDEDNRMLWRFNRRRLLGEDIRDGVLYCSGRLDTKIGGKEVKADQEATSPRRSLYFEIFPEAGGVMKFLETFDAPNPGECYRRQSSIAPQQALAMSNSRLMLNESRAAARRVWKSLKKPSPTAFVNAAFESLLSRAATDAERDRCLKFLQRQELLFKGADRATLVGTPAKGGVAASADPPARAREGLIRVLFNHNDFVTLP